MYKVLMLDEAKKFVSSTNKKMRAKITRTISLLKQSGPMLTMPYVKKFRDFDIYELRVKFSSDIVRLFYFFHKDKLYVITSGYFKKSNKTDKNEIERAIYLKHKFLLEAKNEDN